VSSGDSGTFRSFSLHWDWQSHIQVSPWGLAVKNAFFTCKEGPSGSAVWAQTDSQPEAFSTTGEETNCQRTMFGKACYSNTSKGRGLPMWTNSQDTTLPVTNVLPCSSSPGITHLPSVLTPLVCPPSHLCLAPRTFRLRPSNPHVSKRLRPSQLWLRPSYVPITPLKPVCKIMQAASLRECKRLRSFLRPRKVDPPHWVEAASAPCPPIKPICGYLIYTWAQ